MRTKEQKTVNAIDLVHTELCVKLSINSKTVATNPDPLGGHTSRLAGGEENCYRSAPCVDENRVDGKTYENHVEHERTFLSPWTTTTTHGFFAHMSQICFFRISLYPNCVILV